MLDQISTNGHEKPVDISDCDKEQIHIPGLIQPHGFLLVLSPNDLEILQLSRNLIERLEMPCEELLGHSLVEFLEKPMLVSLEDYLHFDNIKTLVPLPLAFGIKSKKLKPFLTTCIAHRQRHLIILELEVPQAHTLPETIVPTASKSTQLHTALERLHKTNSLVQALKIAVSAIQMITGYDRVMVYKFGENGDGEVIAELKKPRSEPFLGLRYPASDIPKQARELYKKNLSRLLVDVNYKAVEIIPNINPSTDVPLDMSHCGLRSFSPIHIEYLRNMGVQATLTLSIVIEGELWGLIACHHDSTLHQPHWIIAACQLLSLNLSLKIFALERQKKHETNELLAGLTKKLIAKLRTDENRFDLSLADCAKDLLNIFDCSGAAIISDEEMHTVGKVPPKSDIRKCIDAVRQKNTPIFFTDHLKGDLSLAIDENFAGLCVFRFGKSREDWLCLYRKSKIQLVKWAGNPNKPFTPSITNSTTPLTLHPRASFALWTEKVTNKSLLWTASQIQAAEDLREEIMELKKENLDRDLRAAEILANDRGDFVASVAHDLTNPILGALRILKLMKEGGLGDSISAAKDLISMIIDSHTQLLARIKSILLMYQFEGTTPPLVRTPVDLQLLLSHILSSSQETSGKLVELQKSDNMFFAMADQDSLSRVFENLVGNAIKYTPKEGVITASIDTDETKKTAIITLKNTGVGIKESEIPKLFERFTRGSRGRQLAEGSGLGLYICKKIVTAHGGTIVCETAKNLWTKFIVTLPLE